jgi:beta-mannosidase
MDELAVRWVANKSWTYTTTFELPSNAEEGNRTDLVFKGLDTLATVKLNGHKILEADNMFLEYRVDVTDKLTQKNELEIVFDSAYLRGYELIKEHEHEHKFLTRTTDRGRLPVRKCQCHWGWDWGPILITAGPWRPVLLETYSCRVDDVWFQATLREDLKGVNGRLFARVDIGKHTGSERASVRFSLSLNNEVAFESEGNINEDGLATTNFEIKDPFLWYPRGYGQQSRYELKASLTVDGSSQSSKTKLVGFRKVELIQEKDEFGKSFYFRINHIDVFAGGSCWIPADSFIPRVGQDGYRKWMELMAEGNQIMTRYDNS